MNQRVFDNYQRQGQLDQQLDKSWKHELYFLSLLTPQPHTVGSSIRALIGVVKKEVTDYYVLTLSGKTLPPLSELDFVDYQVTPLRDRRREYFSSGVEPGLFFHSD